MFVGSEFLNGFESTKYTDFSNEKKTWFMFLNLHLYTSTDWFHMRSIRIKRQNLDYANNNIYWTKLLNLKKR